MSKGVTLTNASGLLLQSRGQRTKPLVLQVTTNLTGWTPIYIKTTPLLPVSNLNTDAANRPKRFYRLNTGRN